MGAQSNLGPAYQYDGLGVAQAEAEAVARYRQTAEQAEVYALLRGGR